MQHPAPPPTATAPAPRGPPTAPLHAADGTHRGSTLYPFTAPRCALAQPLKVLTHSLTRRATASTHSDAVPCGTAVPQHSSATPLRCPASRPCTALHCLPQPRDPLCPLPLPPAPRATGSTLAYSPRFPTAAQVGLGAAWATAKHLPAAPSPTALQYPPWQSPVAPLHGPAPRPRIVLLRRPARRPFGAPSHASAPRLALCGSPPVARLPSAYGLWPPQRSPPGYPTSAAYPAQRAIAPPAAPHGLHRPYGVTAAPLRAGPRLAQGVSGRIP